MNIMRRVFLRLLGVSIVSSLALFIGAPFLVYRRSATSRRKEDEGVIYTPRNGLRIVLPLPRLRGAISLEEAIANRRSIREYLDEPIALDQLSQVLWAAQGITETRYGFRAAPSAGATYPLEIYAVVAPRGVAYRDGFLDPGSYKYLPHSHELLLVKKGDLVSQLYRAAIEQEWVREAPVNLVITAVYERTTKRYGSRGIRYVHMEAGHAGQNIYLQATAIGLATVAIGAFIDEDVRRIIGASEKEHPLYIMPLAKPRSIYRLEEDKFIEYIQINRK